jgi:hypothetical protein
MSSAGQVTTPDKDERWMQLASQIERERDAKKIIQLAFELIAEFDRAHPKEANCDPKPAS